MKKMIFAVSVVLLALVQTHAQTVYDAVDFSTKDLDGTALSLIHISEPTRPY